MALQQFGWFPLKLCRPTQESRQSQELGEHLSKSAHLKLFESFRLNTHTPTSNVWPFIFSFKFPLCLCRTLWLRPEGPKKSREIFQTAVQFLYFFVWLESTLQMIACVCARTRVCPSVHTHARISSLWNDRSVLSQPQGALFKLQELWIIFSSHWSFHFFCTNFITLSCRPPLLAPPASPFWPSIWYLPPSSRIVIVFIPTCFVGLCFASLESSKRFCCFSIFISTKGQGVFTRFSLAHSSQSLAVFFPLLSVRSLRRPSSAS